MNKIKQKFSKFLGKYILLGGGSFILGFFAYYAINYKRSNKLNYSFRKIENDIPIEMLEKILLKIKEKIILSFVAYFDKCSSFINRGKLNKSQSKDEIVLNPHITEESAKNISDNLDISMKQEFKRLIECIYF